MAPKPPAGPNRKSTTRKAAPSPQKPAAPAIATLDDLVAAAIGTDFADQTARQTLQNALTAFAQASGPDFPGYPYLTSAIAELESHDPDDTTPPAITEASVCALLEAAQQGLPATPSDGNATAGDATPNSANENTPDSIFGDDIDPELLSEFYTEVAEHLEASESALLSMESDPGDAEAINTVFRAFHTIKGTSGFLGLTAITELAHEAETLLGRLRNGEIQYGGHIADLALRAVDTMKALTNDTRSGAGGLPDGYHELLQVLGSPISNAPAEPAPTGAGQPETASDEIRDPAPGTARRNTTTGTAESSVRVRTDRLDRLIDMVGELVIAQSMLAQDSTAVSGQHLELSKKIGHSGKIVRDLQDLSMSMRMVPLKAAFQKIARLVRDLAHRSGKQVDFICKGEETEIDRNMVDVVGDPLMHMVRNSVDHGLEPAAERTAAGKPAAGQLTISACHSGGSIVIEIRDDGRGLQREKILAKALAKGLIDSDKGLADGEIYNLLFLPGFSTSDKVTDISGRGVGMDVVRRSIDSLRGRIDIESTPGEGCTFRISLPLTMAITDGMLLKVGSQRYILPTISILMSSRADAGAISTIAGRHEMITLRGELMPIVRLHRLFNITDAVEDPTRGLMVVIGDGARCCALLVDELLGQQQVVAKSLGDGIGKVDSISGGAILGDGRVGLILDAAELIQLARRTESFLSSDATVTPPLREPEDSAEPQKPSVIEAPEAPEPILEGSTL